jgi:DNA mismatch endonuclease (patch repair protein)
MRDPQVTSRIMRAVKSKDTKPELALRHELHSRGIRYRLNSTNIVGKPDLAFKKYKLAVFVDGDLWHGNEHKRRGLPDLECLFPSRTDFWCSKIRANMARDNEVNRLLTTLGWTILRFWGSVVEHITSAAAITVIEHLSSFKARRMPTAGSLE